jgi:hypothetical protein
MVERWFEQKIPGSGISAELNQRPPERWGVKPIYQILTSFRSWKLVVTMSQNNWGLFLQITGVGNSIPLIYLIIFENFPENSQKAYQNWRITSKKCSTAFLLPPSVTGWSTESNFDVREF